MLQIHFHLGQGSSEDLIPSRHMGRTVIQGRSGRKDPPDRRAGAAGPLVPGGFDSAPTAPDPPRDIAVLRPSDEKIVVADAPGFNKVDAYPAIYRAHFSVVVGSREDANLAQADYDVRIEKTNADDVPNKENVLIPVMTSHLAKGTWPL